MKVETLRGAPLFLATFLGGLVLALFAGVDTVGAQGCGAKLNYGCPKEIPKQTTYQCSISEGIKKEEPNKGARCMRDKPCSEPTPQGSEPGTCVSPLCCKASREGKLPQGKQDGKKKKEKGGGGGAPQMPQIPKKEPKKEQPKQQNQNQNPLTNATSGTSTSPGLFDSLFGDDDSEDDADSEESESPLEHLKNWLQRGVDAFTGAGGEDGGTDAEEAADTEFGTALSEGGIANPGSEDGGTGDGGDGTDYTKPGSTFVDSSEEGDARPPSGFWAWLNRLWTAVGF